MKPSKAKPSPANIVEYIHRELATQSWDQEIMIKAGQALGAVEAKFRYESREFNYAFRVVCREALELFGTRNAERKPRGRQAWRLKLFEMWSAGELNTDKAGQIVREHAACLAAKVKRPAPEPPRKITWACSGILGNAFKFEHSTAVALYKAVEHMNRKTENFLVGECFEGERINKLVNEIIRAAAEAITNFVPGSHLGFRTPFVFRARDEKKSERETRLMLDLLCR